MDCQSVAGQLGRYVDGELPVAPATAVEAHLARCARCATEVQVLRRLAGELSAAGSPRVPDELWPAIQRRLDQAGASAAASAALPWRWPLAAAASVIFVVGLGLYGLLWSDGVSSRAEASTVNFGVLLDALPLDPDKAFRKFLTLYHAREIAPYAAKQHAPNLRFDVPEALPGGFRLQSVYALRIEGAAGIAARYSRPGELLATIFHPPVQREDFGTHKDYECVVGKHRGHMVAVGEWKMVHLTDATTCHCVLSRVDEQTELPAIMGAIAPGADATSPEHRHSR